MVSSLAGDEHPQGDPSENIFVSVRLRPINEKERARNEVSDWECINNNTIIFKSTVPERAMYPSAYAFDRVFGSERTTKQVYEEAAKDVALSVLSGFNSSVFAYGQTSSGKTYTMSGITNYAVSDIFDYIKEHKEREFVLKFSAMEIYNEAVRDLLSADSAPLRLLDDPERGTVVEKLTEETLSDWSHFQDLLAVCEAQRHIGETTLNEMSSRSHQIIRLTIESTAREYSRSGNSSTLAASVSFVDLAGSERASQTLSVGTRLKEGSHINRSLLTLGTVIRKLSKGRTRHVPYRDSKLTRILQNSLGGNAKTAIICTMSPARSHVEQSRNTLLFATCAKEVTTNAQVNLVMNDKALVKQLQRELVRMESELRNMGSNPTTRDPTSLIKEKEQLIEKMDKEIKELTRQRDLAQSRVQDLLRSASEIKTNPLHLDTSHETRNVARRFERISSCHSDIDFPDNPEDNFLLDGSSPKLSSPLALGLDPSQCWVAVDRKPSEDGEDICKVVRCIEMEEPRADTKTQTYNNLLVDISEIERKEGLITPTKDAAVLSSQKSQGEINHINADITYDTLRKKIQDMQKTINSLVGLYPAEHSPNSSDADTFFGHQSDADTSSTKSFKLSRSRRTNITALSTDKVGQNEVQTLNTPLKGSHQSSESFEGSIAEDATSCIEDSEKSVVTYTSDSSDVHKPTENPPVKTDNPERTPINEEPVSETQNATRDCKPVKIKPVAPEPQEPDWSSEFERKRKEIIELWDACHVPLVHRSHFFLLFKGSDPSDSVYLEVELRRLSFLKATGSRTGALSSSLRSLNREREMLGKRIQRKYPKKERENLFMKWGIELNTKQRSLQLARQLWKKNTDMYHIRESAELVAKIVGLVESGQGPKEMFELNFSPQPLCRRRSLNWSYKLSMRR